MLFQGSGKYQNIIHINDDLSIVDLDVEYVVYHSLKCGRGVG
jgi:hypothetical protein